MLFVGQVPWIAGEHVEDIWVIYDRLFDERSVSIEYMSMVEVHSAFGIIVWMKRLDVRGECASEGVDVVDDQKLYNLRLQASTLRWFSVEVGEIEGSPVKHCFEIMVAFDGFDDTVEVLIQLSGELDLNRLR